MGRTRVGNAATARLLQRVIYKDEKAKAEGGAYKDITKVPWYENLPPKSKPIALRLHKRRRKLTVAEADARIAAILAGREAEDEDGYSSGAEHEEVERAEDRLLTVAEFNALANSGTINPFRLRTAQAGIESHFREASRGTIPDLANRLAENPALARELPAVEVGVFDGRVWSFDTRRVVACQMARAKNDQVVINYKKIGEAEKEKRVGSIWSPRPWMGIVTAVREHGMTGGSTPHVNPAYAKQLDELAKHFWTPSSHEGFPEEQPKGGLPVAPAEEAPEEVPEPKPSAEEKAEATATEGSLKAELAKQERDLREWAEANKNAETTEGQREHAQRVWDYIEDSIRKGHNKSAPNGWMLDDVHDTVMALPRRLRTLFLWGWRIPDNPGTARQPLWRKLRGG